MPGKLLIGLGARESGSLDGSGCSLAGCGGVGANAVLMLGVNVWLVVRECCWLCGANCGGVGSNGTFLV